jgi:hypothetical protein
MAGLSAMVAEELLAREGELAWREEKARISEKALAQVSTALDEK